MTYSKEIVREWLDQLAERAKEYPEWVDVFERCYTDTLDNTVEILRRWFNLCVNRGHPSYVASGLNGSTWDPTFMWQKRPSFAARPLLVWSNARWPWSSRIPMPTLSILRRTGKATTRPTTPIWMAGFGSASMKWIRFAIPCNWLTSSGRKLVRLANLMKPLSQRPRKFFISGQWSKTTTTHHTVSSVIRIVRKIPW